MKRESVLDFLARAKARKLDPLAMGFTLTTANPLESGSKGGVRILELEVPGRRVPEGIYSNTMVMLISSSSYIRLGRVTVSPVFPLSSKFSLDTSNVKRLSLEKSLVDDELALLLDKETVLIDSGNERVYLEKRRGRWSVRLPRPLHSRHRD